MMKHRRAATAPHCAAVVLLALLAAAPGPAAAAPAGAPRPEPIGTASSGYDIRVRPDPDGPPTQVAVAVLFLNFLRIDGVTHSASLDFGFVATWRDPRLADPSRNGSAQYALQDIWSPALSILNEERLTPRLPDRVDVSPDGAVLYRQRFVGTITSRLDLRQLPLDRQHIAVQVGSLFYGPDEIDLVHDSERVGILGDFSITGWEVTLDEPRMAEGGYIAAQDRNLLRLEVGLIADRKPGFYVWKVMMPLAFVVVMAWMVFWMDPSNYGPRIGLSTGSVFALVASQMAMGRFLPQLDYLTRLDYFVLGTSLLVFLSLFEAVTTSKLARLEQHDLAYRIDVCSRWVYPVLFVLCVAYVWA